MPNIRRQIVGDLSELGGQAVGKRGIYIQASNGNEFVVTKTQIKAHYQSETGTAAQKKAATLVWLKNQIISALSADMVDFTQIAADFDEVDGEPGLFGVGGL